eukprot:TRINITY_DN44859_c0_g1_i1.p1 TRINITY_DN44859_c0_g1~~TRINITY_DN44859_c0_g1_i1.p1  ORF type:complete len:742 (+),score=102.24 TRINITY_DN44859_c0_g1_i1:137-2362(+)
MDHHRDSDVASETDDEQDEEEEYGETADEGDAPAQEDEGKVQRKLHLFNNANIQASMKRLWDLLPRTEQGILPMEGYIGLNLRLQKSLNQTFDLPRAVESAVGDWGEDVSEGQSEMTFDDFGMFLFELCSLWCGPSISLRVYLLFLNAVFIKITENRGTHTVGLKDLEAVERLPDSFFELVSVQGWAKTQEEQEGLDEEQALNMWLIRNLSTENEQSTLLQVQRQVFQVTHDVRAALLFRKHEDRSREDQDVLDAVKIASRNLDKVTQVDVLHLLDSSAGVASKNGRLSTRGAVDLCPRQWCPPNASRPPAAPGGTAAPVRNSRGKSAGVVVASSRGHSAPGPRARNPGSLAAVLGRPSFENHASSALSLALPNSQPRRHAQGYRSSSRPRELAPVHSDVPLGRAYDIVEARKPRGLVLAGQQTLAGMLAEPGQESYRGESEPTISRISTVGTPMATPPNRPPASDLAGLVAGTSQASGSPTDAATEKVQASFASPEMLAAVADLLAEEEVKAGTDLPSAYKCLEEVKLLPPYRLPLKPAGLYSKQTEPALKVNPGNLVWDITQKQKNQTLVGEAFERSINKLPEHLRPQSEGPALGPLGHPSEPVWFEMAHRLQVILKRQGRRADRRRKRRMRSKLFRGRVKNKPEQRTDGQGLREYLSGNAFENGQGYQSGPGEASGEFLGKVQERYLQNRDRLEALPFRYRGTGGAVVDVYGIGKVPARPKLVVRPVYVPPPLQSSSS